MPCRKGWALSAAAVTLIMGITASLSSTLAYLEAAVSRRPGTEVTFDRDHGLPPSPRPRRMCRNGHQSLRRRPYQAVWRGCHIHVVPATWLGHPRLMQATTIWASTVAR